MIEVDEGEWAYWPTSDGYRFTLGDVGRGLTVMFSDGDRFLFVVSEESFTLSGGTVPFRGVAVCGDRHVAIPAAEVCPPYLGVARFFAALEAVIDALAHYEGALQTVIHFEDSGDWKAQEVAMQAKIAAEEILEEAVKRVVETEFCTVVRDGISVYGLPLSVTHSAAS